MRRDFFIATSTFETVQFELDDIDEVQVCLQIVCDHFGLKLDDFAFGIWDHGTMEMMDDDIMLCDYVTRLEKL